MTTKRKPGLPISDFTPPPPLPPGQVRHWLAGQCADQAFQENPEVARTGVPRYITCGRCADTCRAWLDDIVRENDAGYYARLRESQELAQEVRELREQIEELQEEASGLEDLRVEIEDFRRRHTALKNILLNERSNLALARGSLEKMRAEANAGELYAQASALLRAPQATPQDVARAIEMRALAATVRAVPFYKFVAGDACPSCRDTLLIRSSKFGPFLGCRAFPRCKFGVPIIEADKTKEEPSCLE